MTEPLKANLTVRFAVKHGKADGYAVFEAIDEQEALQMIETGLGEQSVLEGAYVFLDGDAILDLDEFNQNILGEVMKQAKLSPDTFENYSMGGYDRLTNRVTPLNLGMVFPDGTMRFLWTPKDSPLSIQDSIALMRGTITALSEMHKDPYYSSTDAEINGEVEDKAEDRRIERLFELGFWPDVTDTFGFTTKKSRPKP